MEYHEIHSFINKDKPRQLTTLTPTSTINTSTTSATTDSDSSSLGYTSDDSFDSYDAPLRQTSILEQQVRRYYQLHVSPLPQKKQHWHNTPPHPPTEKLGSNSSLSKKFVQGVQSLKNKVASFSPSATSSTSEVSLASSFASDEYHSVGPSSSYGHPHDHVTQSEISTKTNTTPMQPYALPSIERETVVQLSPIPNPNRNTLIQQRPLPPSDQLGPPYSHLPHQIVPTQPTSIIAATHGLLPPTRLLSASKRSRVRKRLHSIWQKHVFKPVSTPRPTRKRTAANGIKNNHLTLQSDMEDVRVTQGGHLGPPDRSSQVSSLASAYPTHSGTNARNTQSRNPSMILAQVTEHIQKLQCLIDIEIQLVEDHQRDIDFYTNQLEQLNHDVQHLNHKVSLTLSNIENNMDPLQEDIQLTIPLLSQLHTKHQHIVTRFTNDALRNRAKDIFNILQSKVKSAEQDIRRWDTITFWTTLISVILLACVFILWLAYFAGMIVTSILLMVLVSLFYDAS